MSKSKQRKADKWFKHRRRQNLHHLTPKSVWVGHLEPFGMNSKENLTWMHIDKHEIWHRLFKNLTLEEVILMLQRLARAKGRSIPS